MFPWSHKSVVGIDISDRTIEALQLKRSFGMPSVAAYSRVQLPSGVVQDGRVLKPAVLNEQLKILLQRAKPAPIRERMCAVSLPESQVFSRVVTLPAALMPEQVRRAVLLEAEHSLPIPLRESYYDYLVLGRVGEEQEIYFAATRRGIVHQYLEVFRSAGLLPVAFEPESASLARALVRRSLGDRGTTGVLVLDVGTRTTNAHLVVRGSVVGSLTIPRAGEHFTQAVATALKLDAAAAEAKKIAGGFGAGGSNQAVAAALAQGVKPVVAELQRYLAYARIHRRISMAQVILCGGSALMPGFAELLQASLGVRVSVGNPLQRLRMRPSAMPQRQTVLYSNVVGLGLRGIGRDPGRHGINLLAQAQGRIRTEQWRRFFSLPRVDHRLLGMLVAFFASLLVLGVLVWYRNVVPHPASRPPMVLSEIDWSRLQAPRELRLVYAYGEQSEPSGNILRARLLEGDFTAASQFAATGTSTVAVHNGVARVRLVNTTADAHTLVARTRLLTPDGVVLRLREAATVPANGAVVVSVDVPPGVAFNHWPLLIPGLPAHLQSSLYGTEVPNPSAFTSTVSNDDVVQAKDRLRGELWVRASEQFVAQLTGGEWLVPVAIARSDITYADVPLADTAEKNFRGHATQRLAGLAVNKAELITRITEQFGMLERPLASVSFAVAEDNLEQRQISVIITTSVPAVEK